MTNEKMTELKLKGVDSLLFDEAEKAGKVSARTAFNAKYRGDRIGEEIVNDYINTLAIGVTNLVNTFQPEIICIGGGVSGEKEKLIDPLSIIVASEQYTRNNDKKTQIKVASLGNNAGIVGAAGLGK